MKIHFLGTCAGTEPMPDRKHASVAVEAGDRLYWFDAGEGCSYTGHLMGLDLLKVGKIVISHTHMDHMGGLGNLLWNIRKLSGLQSRLPEQGAIELYIPDMPAWEGLHQMLTYTEGKFETKYPIRAHQVEAGVVFDDGIVKVTAFPNTHMSRWEEGRCISYSYLIESAGKRLVYSGDVGSYCELDPAIGDGCDGLIIETGHFGIDAVSQYASEKKIGHIFFSHNGREILNHPEASQEKIQRYFDGRATICTDGMTFIL